MSFLFRWTVTISCWSPVSHTFTQTRYHFYSKTCVSQCVQIRLRSSYRGWRSLWSTTTTNSKDMLSQSTLFVVRFFIVKGSSKWTLTKRWSGQKEGTGYRVHLPREQVTWIFQISRREGGVTSSRNSFPWASYEHVVRTSGDVTWDDTSTVWTSGDVTWDDTSAFHDRSRWEDTQNQHGVVTLTLYNKVNVTMDKILDDSQKSIHSDMSTYLKVCPKCGNLNILSPTIPSGITGTIVCVIVTRRILTTSVSSVGFYISVVNVSRHNVLKEGWDSVSPQFCM